MKKILQILKILLDILQLFSYTCSSYKNQYFINYWKETGRYEHFQVIDFTAL